MNRAIATPPFPGIPSIVDGSEAVAHVETRISEGCCAYPITPSTTMAALFQAGVADGKTNLWGTPLRFLEPESEHSSASAAEGFALAGGRVTNFTSGQGLILMKEVLYAISGKRLPIVFHVGARALTSQALNIHAGHDDVMGVADCGWGIVFARNAQEAADLGAIARRAAEESETPILVCQDGFLTTHTLENVLLPEDELLRTFVGDPRNRLLDLFDPAEALMTGVVANQDSYMKGRVAQRAFVGRQAAALGSAFADWGRLTGRHYAPVQAYRCDDAEEVLIAMGTIAESAITVVDHLRRQGRRVGCAAVTVFRPFPADELTAVVRNALAIGVVERTDEPAAVDNPLARELKAALADRAVDGAPLPRVVSATAGLGSRDVSIGDLEAVFDWLADPEAVRRRRRVVLGVTHPDALLPTSLHLRPAGAYSLRGHSVGGFGSVSSNRLIATVVADLFGRYVQAYPRYGSEKKGLPTTYYLTIADEPIRQHAELQEVDFVPVQDSAVFRYGAPLHGLVDGGTLFLQTALTNPEEIWASLPASARAEMVARSIRLAALDTAALARARAPRADLEVRMQGVALVGVFLRLTPFAAKAGLDREALLGAIRPGMTRAFGKRGSKVVDANLAVVADAYDGVIDVTAALGSLDRSNRSLTVIPTATSTGILEEALP